MGMSSAPSWKKPSLNNSKRIPEITRGFLLFIALDTIGKIRYNMKNDEFRR